MFQIDWSKYKEISEAVKHAPEEYRPHSHWLDYEKGAEANLRKDPMSIYGMEVIGVPGWVGGGSAHETPWKHHDRYIGFVSELDDLKLLDRYPKTYKSRQFLDAVAEINLMYKYCGLRDGLTLLDLGGGYGRLAEFLLPQFKVSYIVVEAVALSLLVAPQYVSQVLGINVNSYWGAKDNNFSKYAFSVWPAWEIQEIITQADILINIHSMQEMGDTKCGSYLNLFDKFKKEDTFIFLKNNYKYITRNWNFPNRWKFIYEHKAWPCTEGLVDGVWQDTPRTWVRIFQ